MEGLTIYLSRAILLAAVIAAGSAWVRKGGRTRRDIAVSVGLLAFAGWLGALSWFFPDHRGLIEHGILAAVILHPYSLARLSDHLVMIPRRVRTAIGVGVGVGAVLIVVTSTVPARFGPALALAYFLLSEVYLAGAIVIAGDLAGGITRSRLRLAALAPGLLALAGAAWAVSWGVAPAAVSLGLGHLVLAAAATATLVGFAPPRTLRQHWRLVAMEQHLESSLDVPLGRGFRPIADHLMEAAIATTGASHVLLALRPTDDEHFIVVEDGVDGMQGLGRLEGAMLEAFQGGRPVLVDTRDRETAESDRFLLTRLKAKALLVVPFTSQSNQWGLLIVTYRWSPLFPREDAEVLGLIGRHSAMILEQGRVLDEQSELIQDLRVQTEALEHSNEELRAFSYAVSHDIRTPIVTHMWLLEELQEMLGSHGDEPDVRERFEQIQHNLDGMWSLTSDLLELARINHEPEEERPVDLKAVIDEVVALVGEAQGEKPVRFTFEGPLPVLNGDRVRFQQLFSNLISNAIKYAPDEGADVRIEARQVGEPVTGQVEIAVTDNGPGVAADYRERIFQVCVRAPDPLGRKIPGTGIGLAIARKVTRQYEGDLGVMEAPGGGARFVVTFPMMRLATNATAPPATPELEASRIPFTEREQLADVARHALTRRLSGTGALGTNASKS